MKTETLKQTTQNKKFVRMVMPTQFCPKLSLSHLLVYSYRAYQDEYGTTPGLMQVVKATGLSKETIRAADQTLLSLNLLDYNRKPIEPPAGYFVKREKAGIGHWRHNYSYWDCFIHQPGSTRYDHIDIAIWSFLAHSVTTQFAPRAGWTATYFSTILGACRQTIQKALKHLEQYKILTTHGRTIRLYPPQAEFLNALQDARNTTAPVEFATEFAPEYKTVEETPPNVVELENMLKQFFSPLVAKEKAQKAVADRISREAFEQIEIRLKSQANIVVAGGNKV
jgi:hypothetical protein